MHTLVISTGSNLGNRLDNLKSANSLIEDRIGRIRKSSCIYESGAWGYRSKNLFYNQCHELVTELGPEDCLERILEIERQLSRERDGSGYSDRIIDIDILFFDDLVLDKDPLIIPHQRMLDRKFVLLPLAEILPDMNHPVVHKPVHELLEICSDPGEVVPVERG